MLEWYEASSSNELIRSPLIFIPVAIDYKAATGSFTLKFLDDTDCEINPTLREKLKHDFKIELPHWSDLAKENGNGNGNGQVTSYAPPALTNLLNAIQEAIHDMASAGDGRWTIQGDAVHLGRFAFQKLVMYQDLQRHEADALGHPLLRILGGEALRPPLPTGMPNRTEFDDRLVHSTSEILDADSSQQEAILPANRVSVLC